LQNVTNNDFQTWAIFSCLLPNKILSVSQWADEYRFLSQKASSEPGRYRSSRTPYVTEIMDCLSNNNPVKEVVFMKGSQIGASEIGCCWLGYIMDHAPGPTLMVLPTVDMAKKISKQRIEPMIEESPKLKNLVSEKKSRDSSNTMLGKEFPGGILLMTGANSASGLRSLPIRYIFLDEIDAYPLDVEGEGNPIDLAKARARTFHKRKIFQVSTPTVSGLSHIETLFEASDKRFFQLPCIHCGKYQKLEFKNLVWPENKPKKAVYQCCFCSKDIENWQKTDMLAKGKWVSESVSDTAGFHLNALYSPVGWYSWAEIAEDFIKAKKTPEKLRTFINTVLGETWKEKAERPDWQRLYERRELYTIGKVPAGALFLTAGVDVQRDRLEIEVVGWGRNKISWSVDYQVIYGDTTQPDVWKNLEKLLHQQFETELDSRKYLGIKLMAVDSGYNTQTVYSWVRQFSQTKVIAVKGRDTLQQIFSRPQAVDVTSSGKTLRRSLKVWGIGVNVVKDELYSWLRQAKSVDGQPDNYGFCHFPQYEDEFFKQLTAEELVTKVLKGYPKQEWQKIRERNEALDCRVYSRAAASICGMDRFSEERWKALEGEFGLISTNKEIQADVISQQQPVVATIQRRPSGWL